MFPPAALPASVYHCDIPPLHGQKTQVPPFSHFLILYFNPTARPAGSIFQEFPASKVLVPLLLFLSCLYICLEDGTGLAAGGQSEHFSLQEGTSQKRISAWPSCSNLFRLCRTGKAKSFHSYETRCLPGLPSHCAQVPNSKSL